MPKWQRISRQCPLELAIVSRAMTTVRYEGRSFEALDVGIPETRAKTALEGR